MLDFFTDTKHQGKLDIQVRVTIIFLNEIKLLVNIYLKKEYLTKLTSKSVVTPTPLMNPFCYSKVSGSKVLSTDFCCCLNESIL